MSYRRRSIFSGPLFAQLAALFALVAAVTGCDAVADPPAGPASAPGAVAAPENVSSPEHGTESIRVSFDFGGEATAQQREVEWRDGMTVLDALLALEASGIVVQHRGQGSRAFVESVNGVKNRGAGPNWLYYVNDKKADRSAGAYPLQKRDVVLWKYTAEK
ncbi:MAG: DUF4430 domain-containing protein [Planctomycetota bacterium]|nr:DUF4430 domain-containing protein [Planctomycetota bacterium]